MGWISVINIYVNGGSSSSPYYDFYNDKEMSSKIDELKLDINNRYRFIANGISRSHPFYISDMGFNQKNSNNIEINGDGSYNSGIEGTNQEFILTIKSTFDQLTDKLFYYCTSHRDKMIKEIDLE
jgi:hypothetical protein